MTEPSNENAENGRGWTVIDRDTQQCKEELNNEAVEALADLLVDNGRRVEIIKPDGSRELRDGSGGDEG